MNRTTKRSFIRAGAAAVVGATAMTGVALLSANGQDASLRCALLSGNGTKIERFEQHTTSCPPDRPHKDVKFLPAPPTTPPTHDPVTQIRTGPTYVIEPTQVRETWEVRAKTQQEIDQESDAALDRARTTTQYHSTWQIVNTLEALRVHLGLTKQQMDDLVNQHKLTESQYRAWLKDRKAEAVATHTGSGQ